MSLYDDINEVTVLQRAKKTVPKSRRIAAHVPTTCVVFFSCIVLTAGCYVGLN